ncbi:hypothetical protein GGH99_000303 [Coemansia sp. RSA 1285]|nr:hypothetical protein GGH99_000303 [Coemansia sp. RSA 1285]
MAVISPALAKALSDRLYDKQRAATIKIERLVLDALDADDEQRIYELLAELSTEYATSEREASRIGGLVALAATAVALTHLNIRPFLPHIVPPIVSALSDGESKVRYFACESLYNVTKVSRGHILRWFNDIFDGLARVTADSVKTVKDGADYLDRLVKDVVAEQAATCLDWYEDEGEAGREREEEEGARQTSPAAAEAAADGSELEMQEKALAAATSLQTRGPRLAFSLDKFVPLLAERMHTYKPATRLYLIEWIRVLDSVPGLDMIAYLPEFLDGLLRFLSDPNDDVRSKTQSLLGELLNEMTECVELQQLGGEAEDSAMRSRHEHGSGFGPGSGSGSGSGFQASGRFTSPSTAGLPEELRMAARRKRIREERAESAASHGTTPPPAHQQAAASANAISIEFARVMQILIPHLESNDLEIQGTALGWVYQLTWLCPQTVVCAVPRLVNAVLPSVSHPMPAHRHTAEEVNARLRQLVRDAPAPLTVSAGADSRVEEPLNYDHAATAVMELFAKNVHEPTKVAGMQWLLLLHGKAPWRILTPEDMSFPVLLKMLSDSSEQVVRLDLELFAQISLNSSQGESGEDRAHSHKHHAYLQRFLGSLLQMFATDRVLLETRAALMVRQLCAVLDPQLVFCMISEHLCEEERADLEFVSVMVQHLSWILVTAPETERLRRVLRGYNAALPLDMPHLRTSPPPLTTAQQQQALQRSRQQNQQQQQQQQQQQSQQQKNAGRTTPAADTQRADRTRQTLAMAVQRIQRGVEQNRRNHALFTQLFGAWCHNPAACLTLCLLSQHYETSAELVCVFGQVPLDLTVSFLVQLDKLVQLIESPVFTFLRLQLLDPSEQPQLLRTLYGLLMLLPQSSAFAILRNRLASVGGGGGAVSPFSCGGNGGAAIGPMVRGSAASGASAGGGGGGDAMDHDLAPASRGCQYHCHYHYHMHRHPAASASSGTSRSATSTTSTTTAVANNNSTGAAADVRRIVQLLVATEQSYQSGGVAASHRQQSSAKSNSGNGNGNNSTTAAAAAAAAIPESEGPRGAENSSSNVASDLPTAAQILQQMGDLQLYHHPSLARDRDDHDDAFTNSGIAASFSDYSEFEGGGGGSGSCACGCRYCCNHTGKSSSGSIVSEGSIVGRLVAEYRSVRQRHTEAIMRSRGQSQHQHQHQQHNQNHHFYK